MLIRRQFGSGKLPDRGGGLALIQCRLCRREITVNYRRGPPARGRGPDLSDRATRRDGQQPRGEPALRIVPVDAGPRVQERLLHNIIRVSGPKPVARDEPADAGFEAIDQLSKGGRAARPGLSGELLVGGLRSPVLKGVLFQIRSTSVGQ